MLIDPLINGFAELHERHRDMRLDVDNMSYEVLHSNPSLMTGRLL